MSCTLYQLGAFLRQKPGRWTGGKKTEPYLFAGSFRTTDINSDAQGTVRGGFNPLAPDTSLGTLKNAGNWTVRAASFSATMGHYHQVTLFINPSINIGVFDNIYLGPFSVEISTSHLSGRLTMIRASGVDEKERVEYSMSVGARGVGRLVRKLTQTSGVEKVSSIDGIDSLKVSWVGAPAPTGGDEPSASHRIDGPRRNREPRGHHVDFLRGLSTCPLKLSAKGFATGRRDFH
jgi:hypothetical protein